MNFLQFFTGLYMGCFMAFMVWKSKSIATSALFHLLNNSISVIMTFHPEILESIPLLGKANPSPLENAILAAVGVIFLAVGFLLYGVFRRRNPENTKT